MFGKNQVRGKTDNADLLSVHSIFYTVQGEGPYAGMPAVFIRLFGCNLRCWFCDTDFESVEGTMTPARIVFEVNQLLRDRTPDVEYPLVVITGGEPLRQDIGLLVSQLLNNKFRVQIETAGTLWQESMDALMIDWPPSRLMIVCSPKTGKVHPCIASFCYEWKYIIRSDDKLSDRGLPVTSTQHPNQKLALFVPDHALVRHNVCTVWIQPCEEYHADGTPDHVTTRKSADLCAQLAMKYGYRVSLQQHKILNLP